MICICWLAPCCRVGVHALHTWVGRTLGINVGPLDGLALGEAEGIAVAVG